MSEKKRSKTNTSQYNADRYQARKKELLASRKQRYQDDKEYREETIARAVTRYWTRVRSVKSEEQSVFVEDLKPAVEFEVQVAHPDDSRKGSTVGVRGFTVLQVALLLGRAANTVRAWERSGVIPEPRWRAEDLPEGGSRASVRNPRSRVYTEDEVRVLLVARPLLALPGARRQGSLFSTTVAEEFARMDQGLSLVMK